ncbi:hypothetical protein FRC08_003286 [Ceratobasidium sp. 394]|nr:hypothetical protein FRC08_003286 [Ceratobasidium sp. 394]KAG9101229.1 hypothetical protein FS749_009156 [Ceratobasidium sp. UAMH 11750]
MDPSGFGTYDAWMATHGELFDPYTGRVQQVPVGRFLPMSSPESEGWTSGSSPGMYSFNEPHYTTQAYNHESFGGLEPGREYRAGSSTNRQAEETRSPGVAEGRRSEDDERRREGRLTRSSKYVD